MLDFPHLEFHRSGIGLVPSGPGQEGAAIYVEGVMGLNRALRSCTCDNGRATTCSHVKDLSRAVRAWFEAAGGNRWQEIFEATAWARLATLLSEEAPRPAAEVRVERFGGGASAVGLRFRARGRKRRRTSGTTAGAGADAAGAELARWLGDGLGRIRLLERLGLALGEEGTVDRAGVLERLAMFQWTKQEHLLAKAGMKSRRQTLEESFWHRFAYHAVRELGPDGTRFHPAVDRETGRFALVCRRTQVTQVVEAIDQNAGGGPKAAAGEVFAEITLPRESVQRALRMLAEIFPGQEDLEVRPIPLRTIFHVSAATEITGEAAQAVDVRPVIQALQSGGEERLLEQAEVERFRYGRLIYLKELGVLAELERVGRERKFKAPRRLRLDWSRVPSFLDEHREGMEEGAVRFEGLLGERRVFREVDSVTVAAVDPDEAEGRSWYWLAVDYGFGDSAVSLAHILDARSRGVPYLETAEGWVDLRAPAFRHLDALIERLDRDREGLRRGGDDEEAGVGDRLRLAPVELLGLQAGTGRAIQVADQVAEGEAGEAARGRAQLVRRLVEVRPAVPYHQPEALASPLRPYQERGVEWLLFLWEHRLGGVLADDMGLGKTHQAMALMALLGAEGAAPGPFLVVCPTSVMSHWRDKVRDHAPGLRAIVHHGTGRDLQRALGEVGDGGLVVTSYGVLRRDEAEIAAVPWALAVFDEIQYLKNPDTRGWQAGARVPAELRLGLTGTPIENSLTELKALFDLVLPGYLGTDKAFEDWYGDGGELPGRERLAELRRLVAPFILRRTKEAVLDELPEKIEDVRTARLSDDQVKLYREAIATRGKELAGRIAGGAEPVPYIHVFALLNLLKQICDHPALALRQLDRPEELASGKWDLYRELLSECLEAGLKVVVFTQYLGMIELMARDLEERGVEFVTLTGSSRDRGAIVDRFNGDAECRVFLGSLKAGGTGIDLVGGSVVIHYDRWWNAAREDQATDRVHRIGQRRAVQVFKLVTEGTLEEKIHALIEKKRRLLEAVVQEDDHRLAKVFSRAELLELLAEPG